MLAQEEAELRKLKNELATVNARIRMTEMSMNKDKQMLSTTLMGLKKRRQELQIKIAEFPEPPDFTPNPKGSVPTPAPAVLRAYAAM